MKKNFFITLEGCEGVGKSTAMDSMVQFFEARRIACVMTREPGGTKIGEKIRAILLSDQPEEMRPTTELLLMFAARAQHIEQVITPALSAGKAVISDRFTDASFAYQGGGRGVALESIEQLTHLVQGDLTPDLTLLLDAPVSVGLSRMKERKAPDRIEQENRLFFERVRKSYLQLAKQFPARFTVIDASKSIDEVQTQIHQALQILCEAN